MCLVTIISYTERLFNYLSRRTECVKLHMTIVMLVSILHEVNMNREMKHLSIIIYKPVNTRCHFGDIVNIQRCKVYPHVLRQKYGITTFRPSALFNSRLPLLK